MSALLGLYSLLRVRRPPSPSAAKLPASARILLRPSRLPPSRNDTLELVVASQGELNYKVGMQAGATLVYAWSAAPKVRTLSCQFAGHETTAASQAHSAFVAQSSGWYRWRWKNQSRRSVTIHLKLSGYYELATVPNVGVPSGGMAYDR